MEDTRKKAIILMNLGSPDSTEVKDVAKYLREFLMDERVIDVPYLLRLLLIKGIVVPFRAPKSAHAYESIWTDEGSPFIVLTKQLQNAVQPHFDMPVEIAMRYGNPTPEIAYENLLKQVPDLEEVILFPLYPHYAMSSYETAVEYMKEIHQKKKYRFSLSVVEPFYNDDEYINALSQSIKPFTDQPFDKILFSFHGIPERHVRKTDPTGRHCLTVADCCHVASPAHEFCYRHQTLVTAELVSKELSSRKRNGNKRFNRGLGATNGCCLIPPCGLPSCPTKALKICWWFVPAFISDCLETLEEMAVEGKDIFLNAGGESFTAIPCLNINPLWVNALVSLVKNKVSHNCQPATGIQPVSHFRQERKFWSDRMVVENGLTGIRFSDDLPGCWRLDFSSRFSIHVSTTLKPYTSSLLSPGLPVCFICQGCLFITPKPTINHADEKAILQQAVRHYDEAVCGMALRCHRQCSHLSLVRGCGYMLGAFRNGCYQARFCFFLYLYFISLHLIFKQQIRGVYKYTSQQLRVWNEVATIFLIAIVMLAVVKEAISLAWGLGGLVCLSLF